MVEHILKGHIIVFPNGIKMYIGIVDKEESLAGIVDRTYRPYRGTAVYGIKVVGVDMGNYRFVLNKKYKNKLYNNIINGVEYYK